MPRTVDEYIAQTKAMIERGAICETIEPTSPVLFINHNSSMVGGGAIYVPDFGNLVCYCRYDMAPSEFDPDDYWKRSGVPQEEAPQRLTAVESGLDQLLEAFVQRGYQPELGKQLLDLWNEHFVECEFVSLYVLPDDLDSLLQEVGNPLNDFDDDEGDDTESPEDDDSAVTAAAIGFDLNNPEHRQKLAERLAEAG